MATDSTTKSRPKPMTIWRIRQRTTGEFKKSGRGMYARNTRTMWAGIGQARRAYQEMDEDYRSNCDLVEYELREVRVVDPLTLG